MKIIDTHCHLNDDKLYFQVEDVIQRAKENHVVAAFNNADSLPSFFRILDLQDRFPDFCHAVLGIHPEFASEAEETFHQAYEQIQKNRDRISAIGEIGLDYHYSKEIAVIQAQKKRFIEQIRLAKELSLPIVIHSRDADFDTLSIIKEELPPKLDLHCFSGSYEILKEYLKLPIEVHIGIGGVCTFKNARVIREVISKTDLSLFLTETDSPYLAPVPHRGENNEPGYLPLIVREIAAEKNRDEEEVATQLYKNGKRFYGME